MLRVPSNFTLTLAAGTKLTCAEAVKALLKRKRHWEIRSAGSGSKGEPADRNSLLSAGSRRSGASTAMPSWASHHSPRRAGHSAPHRHQGDD